MRQFFKEENSKDDAEGKVTEVKGFVSQEIFKILLMIGILCCVTGFIVDIAIGSVSRIVTMMPVFLCVYLSLLLSLIHRMDLHHNMRLASLGVMAAIFVELVFDDGGMLWSIIVPPIAFAAFGKKEGFLWTIANFTLMVAWLVWDSISASHFSYVVISNLIMTYIVSTLASYFYTSHINRTHQLVLNHARKQERLEIAQRLSGGIAHLINNEMQVVTGHASMLKMDLHEPSQLEKISRIIESAYQSSSHANQLLAYAESAPKYMQDHDFRNILLPLSETWVKELPECIELQIDVPEYLPTCHCDSQKIQHALNILFENAYEACQSSGLIVLQTSTEHLQQDMPERHLKKGEYIKISIRDDGIGIKHSEVDKIFEPFFSSKFMGRGLGLPAADGIIKQHGGSLHVQSSAGNGAVFTIFLPALAES